MRVSEPRAQLYKVDTFPPLLQKRSLQPNRGSAGGRIEPSSARCTASCELRRHRCTSLPGARGERLRVFQVSSHIGFLPQSSCMYLPG